MKHKSRLEKLTNQLKPDEVTIHCIGWADCTWSESEGLFRQAGSTKQPRNSSCGLINRK
jgi:hypothetical protein